MTVLSRLTKLVDEAGNIAERADQETFSYRFSDCDDIWVLKIG